MIDRVPSYFTHNLECPIMFPRLSNSPYNSGELKVQWVSSDSPTKPISSFNPRTPEWMSASYRPLEDKGQPCRCLPELTRRLATKICCSAMRRNSQCDAPSGIPS
ncbi:UNVERIFIED_CONTAM: hypothetical protein FKN15_024982 [Acipenser sinensis]